MGGGSRRPVMAMRGGEARHGSEGRDGGRRWEERRGKGESVEEEKQGRGKEKRKKK